MSKIVFKIITKEQLKYQVHSSQELSFIKD